MNRPLRLPQGLEQRLRRIERALELIADDLDIDLDAHDSPGVRHGMPSTAAEYDAMCRRLADEVGR